jgi:hypothetical protein
MSGEESVSGSDSKRISVLFQKATASSSVREKNYFLNELKKLMKKHSTDYQNAINTAQDIKEKTERLQQN